MLERNGERQGSGSGFLIPGFIVTASHNLREEPFDAMLIRFHDERVANPVRLGADDVLAAINVESPRSHHQRDVSSRSI